MTTFLDRDNSVPTRTTVGAGWAMLAGGVLWFVGGGLHPKQDLPGGSVKELLLPEFRDPLWYPGHTLLLVGIGLMAAALAALVRRGALTTPRARTAAAVAAAATSLGTVAALLHLVMAVDADRIAAGAGTPLTDIQLVVETVAAPAFGLSIAVLSVVGAATRTIGNRTAAVFGVIGGAGYALAGGTVLLTDALNPLFPLAGLIGAWGAVTGASVVRRTRRAAMVTPLMCGDPW